MSSFTEYMRQSAVRYNVLVSLAESLNDGHRPKQAALFRFALGNAPMPKAAYAMTRQVSAQRGPSAAMDDEAKIRILWFAMADEDNSFSMRNDDDATALNQTFFIKPMQALLRGFVPGDYPGIRRQLESDTGTPRWSQREQDLLDEIFDTDAGPDRSFGLDQGADAARLNA